MHGLACQQLIYGSVVMCDDGGVSTVVNLVLTVEALNMHSCK